MWGPPTRVGLVVLLAFPWMLPQIPYGAGSAFWGHSITLQGGIAQRGWTTHAASSHPCQQPGWALGFPSGALLASPAASRASSTPASGLSQHFWLLKRGGSHEDGSWEAPAVPAQGDGGFLLMLNHPRLCWGLSLWVHIPSQPPNIPMWDQPCTISSPWVQPEPSWEHPLCHIPILAHPWGVLGALPPLHHTGMPFVLLGLWGNSAALGFSLLFWKFKTFAGRPTRAPPPRREALG